MLLQLLANGVADIDGGRWVAVRNLVLVENGQAVGRTGGEPTRIATATSDENNVFTDQ